jgi:hypothetical protein
VHAYSLHSSLYRKTRTDSAENIVRFNFSRLFPFVSHFSLLFRLHSLEALIRAEKARARGRR